MYHRDIENLSDSSNTASHVSGVSQDRSEAVQLIDKNLNMRMTVRKKSRKGGKA